MNPMVLLLYLYGFVVGVYLPATLVFLLSYFRRWWQTADWSFGAVFRLLWGIIWRIFAALAFLCAVMILIGVSADSGENETILGFMMFAGFFGSIVLFLVGYLYGRSQRKHPGMSAVA